MKRRDPGVFEQLGQAVLSPSPPIPPLLRMLSIVAANTNSAALRELAETESRGYHMNADIPHYRRVIGLLALDGMLHSGHTVEKEQISRSELPEEVRDDVGEEVLLLNGICYLYNLVRTGRDHYELPFPRSIMLVKLMNAERSARYARVTNLYWVASRASIETGLDHFRMKVGELHAEIKNRLPKGRTEPDERDGELVDQAVRAVMQRDAGCTPAVRQAAGPAEPQGPQWLPQAMFVTALITTLATLIMMVRS